MTKKIPLVDGKKRVLIICEGCEEYDYISRLKACGVWNRSVTVDVKNAKSIDELVSRYQYYYQSANYQLIVVFCDTEKEPFEQFLALKKSINKFHGNKASEKVVYFANPCTMQIILSHFEKVKLKNNSKSANAEVIYRLTGVADYRASEKQRNAIMKKITAENYLCMKGNISDLSADYTVVPSSNCKPMFDGLDGDSQKWMKECNKEIEK